MLGLGYLHDSTKFVYRRMAGDRWNVITSIALLAVSLGALAATFTVAYSLLWRPLPYPDPSRLVVITPYSKRMDMELGWPPPYMFNTDLDRLQGWAAFRSGHASVSVDEGSAATSVRTVSVMPRVFALLQPKIVAGRALGDDDAAEAALPVVLLSERLAKALFASGAEGAINRQLTLSGQRKRIVGVVATASAFPFSDIDLWEPLYYSPADRDIGRAGSFGGPNMIAKLAPDQSPEDAQRSIMAAVERNPVLAKIASDIDLDFRVAPLRQLWTSDYTTSIHSILLAAVAIFLITSANLCNLFALRHLRRSHESALLAAFGAPATRTTGYLALEAVAQVALSATAALLLLPVLRTAMTHLGFLPADFPGPVTISLAPFALVVVLALALVGALMMSARLVLRHGTLSAALRQSAPGAGGSTPASRRLRHLLVAAQIAATLPLVYCTALLSISEHRLLSQPVGYTAEDRWVMVLDADSDMEHDQASAQLLNTINQLGTVQGIQAVAATASAPFSDVVSVEAIQTGAGGARSEQDSVYGNFVSANYFSALGLPLIAGRAFSDTEADAAAHVAIVDEAFSRRHFPNGGALGQTIMIATALETAQPHLVVGIVANARQRDLIHADDYASVFRPLAIPYATETIPAQSIELILQTHAPLQASDVRSVIAREAPGFRMSELRPLGERIRATIIDRTRLNRTLVALTAIAVALVTTGLYSAFANLVLVRNCEFGLRKALGQSDLSIFSLVLKGSLLLLAVACCVGAPAALLVARALAGRLYEVSAFDAPVMAGLLLALAMVVVASTLTPALRAGRISPMEALRQD